MWKIEVLVTAIDFSQYVETNKNALWEIAVDTSTVLQYPEAELREYEEDFRECYLAFAREYGMELDDYLRQFFGTNEEGLDALCRENAQDSVKRGPGDVRNFARGKSGDHPGGFGGLQTGLADHLRL